ncbi:GMC oxidoreductase, partial [Pseudomonas sp. CCC4.4]
GDGTPVLDYQVSPYAWDGIRRAYQSMAEIQFAGGAKAVMPLHEDTGYVKTLAQAIKVINGLSLEIFRTRLGSAHVMGGCAMGEDAD